LNHVLDTLFLSRKKEVPNFYQNQKHHHLHQNQYVALKTVPVFKKSQQKRIQRRQTPHHFICNAAFLKWKKQTGCKPVIRREKQLTY